MAIDNNTPSGSSLRRVLAGGLLLTVLTNFFLYIGHVIIARQLAREDYAVFTVVVSFISLMALFADLGLTLLFVRKFAEAEALAASGKKDERGELFGSMLLLRVSMAIIVSVVVYFITPLLGYPAATQHLMLIMLLTLFISSRLMVVRSVGEAFLRGHHKYHFAVLFSVIDALVFALVLFYYSGKTLDLEHAVWVYTFCHIPGFILLFGMILRYAKEIGFKIQFKFSIIRSLMVEGFPLLLGTAFLTIHSQIDALLIDALSSPTQVSAYGASLRILTAIIFFPVVLSSVIGPIVTQSIVKLESEKASRTIERALKILLVAALSIALFLSMASNTVVSVLLGGNKYADVAPLVVIIGWAFIPICFGSFMSDIAVSEGKYWISTSYTLVLMVVSIIFDLILIPRYGAFGAVISKTLAVTFGSITLLLIAEKLQVFQRKKIIRLVFKLLGVGTCCIGVLWGAKTLNLPQFIIYIAVAFIFYITTIHLFKIISLSELVGFISGFLGKKKFATEVND